MLRTTLALVSLVTLAGLFAYPLAYVTFPWTVPVPYMAAIWLASNAFTRVPSRAFWMPSRMMRSPGFNPSEMRMFESTCSAVVTAR